jgi:hypothetical protein
LPLRVTRMKYFAVTNMQAGEVNEYLQSISHIHAPVLSLQYVWLFHNTLNDDDFLVLRLKYNILVPTQAQLQIVESIYKISLNLDEYPA